MMLRSSYPRAFCSRSAAAVLCVLILTLYAPLPARGEAAFTPSGAYPSDADDHGYWVTPMDITDEQSLSYDFDYEYVLGEKEYFVVGDNRYNSHDSRKWNGPDLPVSHVNNVGGSVGPITKGMITGHVRCVFYPFKQARSVPNNTEYIPVEDRP